MLTIYYWSSSPQADLVWNTARCNNAQKSDVMQNEKLKIPLIFSQFFSLSKSRRLNLCPQYSVEMQVFTCLVYVPVNITDAVADTSAQV